MAVIEVLLTTVTSVATVPAKLTVAPGAKFVPTMVSVVPPLTDPEFGDTEDTVGAGPELLRKTKLAIDGTPEPLRINSM